MKAIEIETIKISSADLYNRTAYPHRGIFIVEELENPVINRNNYFFVDNNGVYVLTLYDMPILDIAEEVKRDKDDINLYATLKLIAVARDPNLVIKLLPPTEIK